MHLSRWKTIPICERTSMATSLPLELREFAHEHVRVPVAADRAPVVEVERELRVAADHEVRLQTRARQRVVSARAAVPAQRRLRHAVRAFGRVIDDADAVRD